MIFYISHNYAARVHLEQGIMRDLMRMGHVVHARWITEDHSGKDHSDEEQHRFATEDYQDVSAADYVIHFADQYGERAGKGKFIEVGYAHAVGKRVLVVGELYESSVFYYFGRTKRFKLLTELLDFCETLPKEIDE